MKGRRRARHAALQALYELDVTSHPLEGVLEARTLEFLRSASAQALDRTHRRVIECLIEEHAAGGFAGVPTPEVAVRLKTDLQRVDAAVEFLRGLVPHVEYIGSIVRGVWRNRDAIDRVVGRIAPEWPVAQMSPIDRNVLRIALWEMATDSAPTRVAINEAVELARLFNGEASRRMVNGALGTYVAEGLRLELTAY